MSLIAFSTVSYVAHPSDIEMTKAHWTAYWYIQALKGREVKIPVRFPLRGRPKWQEINDDNKEIAFRLFGYRIYNPLVKILREQADTYYGPIYFVPIPSSSMLINSKEDDSFSIQNMVEWTIHYLNKSKNLNNDIILNETFLHLSSHLPAKIHCDFIQNLNQTSISKILLSNSAKQ